MLRFLWVKNREYCYCVSLERDHVEGFIYHSSKLKTTPFSTAGLWSRSPGPYYTEGEGLRRIWGIAPLLEAIAGHKHAT